MTSFEPAISIGEEYDDNVYLTANNTKTDYITHVIPSIRASYSAPFWDWAFSYAYDYRYYAKDSYQDDHPQKLNLLSTMRIVKDLLFLDVRDEYGRTSLSAVQNYTQQSLKKYLTDYNRFDVNPYTVLQLTSNLTLTAGYQYRNLWYKDPTATNQIVNSAYADLARSVAVRTDLTIRARYDDTHTSTIDEMRTQVLAGARHEFAEGSHLWGSIGINTTSATGTAAGTTSGTTTGTQPIWDAGVVFTRPTATVKLETGRSWIEDPTLIYRREDRYLASLRIGSERTNGGIFVGYRNYGQWRNVDERRYTIAADFFHFLTEELQGTYTFSMDRYNQYPANAPHAMTIVYITDVRLLYRTSESTRLSLTYVYADSYSPDIYTSNYKVNRALIGVTKTF